MKKRIVKRSLIILGLVGLIGVTIILYIMFAPHRDTQSSPVDFNLSAQELVRESLDDAAATNDKYLSEDGDSKIMAITGIVASIEKDFDDNQVVLLKAETDDAGVKCTFMKGTNKNAEALKIGEQTTIKGVYRVAASYDEDFEEYEDVIVEECDVLIKEN
ncbi:MAG: hypothetical protein COA33_012670 [Fluviicola sp.]|nr:hypothetical protein [Fluviicola sp.]